MSRLDDELERLAERGPILPMGTLITLPDAPTQAEAPLIQLWD